MGGEFLYGGGGGFSRDTSFKVVPKGLFAKGGGAAWHWRKTDSMHGTIPHAA